jgi:hypothetical protein
MSARKRCDLERPWRMGLLLGKIHIRFEGVRLHLGRLDSIRLTRLRAFARRGFFCWTLAIN